MDFVCYLISDSSNCVILPSVFRSRSRSPELSLLILLSWFVCSLVWFGFLSSFLTETRINNCCCYRFSHRTSALYSKQRPRSNWLCCVCRHGDMLFLFPSGAPSSSGEVMDTTTPHSSSSIPSISSSSSSSLIPRSVSAPQVQEDEIDQYLAKQDGKIYRNKDPQL